MAGWRAETLHGDSLAIEIEISIYLGIMSGLVLSAVSELLQLQYLATFCIHLLGGFVYSQLVERGCAVYDPSGICS